MNIFPLSHTHDRSLHIRNVHRIKPHQLRDKIAFSTREGMYIVAISSIIHCVAMDNYCQIFRQDGKTITIAKTLKSIEGSLESHGFIRIHKTYLVAIKEIVFVGQDHVLLSNGVEAPLSRQKRPIVLERVMAGLQVVD